MSSLWRRACVSWGKHSNRLLPGVGRPASTNTQRMGLIREDSDNARPGTWTDERTVQQKPTRHHAASIWQVNRQAQPRLWDCCNLD